MRASLGRAAALLAALAVAGTLGGCCGSPAAEQQAPETTASAPAADPADVQFLQDLLVHDQQAVEMCALVPGRTTNARVIEIAREIAAEQRNEISGFRVQLLQWDAPPVGPHSSETEGRVDQVTMDKLRTLNGAEFDRLWLTSMISHHRGSIAMAQHQIDHGKNPDMAAIAQPVVRTQRYQIDQMTPLLGGR